MTEAITTGSSVCIRGVLPLRLLLLCVLCVLCADLLYFAPLTSQVLNEELSKKFTAASYRTCLYTPTSVTPQSSELLRNLSRADLAED